MSLTLTGDNNYSGTYGDIFVLGGNIYGNTTYKDVNAYDGGNETFMFGNLQHKSTVDTSGDVISGTWQSTATGDGGDTVQFSFTFHAGSEGATFNFLTDNALLPDGDAAPQDYSADTDGDADYQAQSSASAWTTNYTNFQHYLETTYGAANVSYSDPETIETGVNNGHPDPDVNLTLDIVATVAGSSSTLTTDNGGNKILLGFTVGSDYAASDHLDLGGNSAITQAMFDQYFTISGDTHISANGNVVNDTVISLGDFAANTGTAAGNHDYGASAGGWSVDLYGVNIADLQAAAANAGQQLDDYVYNTIITHA